MPARAHPLLVESQLSLKRQTSGIGICKHGCSGKGVSLNVQQVVRVSYRRTRLGCITCDKWLLGQRFSCKLTLVPQSTSSIAYFDQARPTQRVQRARLTFCEVLQRKVYSFETLLYETNQHVGF